MVPKNLEVRGDRNGMALLHGRLLLRQCDWGGFPLSLEFEKFPRDTADATRSWGDAVAQIEGLK
jgi:hypothetical protein